MPIIVDLRLPPSTNRFWRGTGRTVVHSSPYTGLRAADAHTVMTAQLRGVRQICGPFAADIVVQRGRGVRRDLRRIILFYHVAHFVGIWPRDRWLLVPNSSSGMAAAF